MSKLAGLLFIFLPGVVMDVSTCQYNAEANTNEENETG